MWHAVWAVTLCVVGALAGCSPPATTTDAPEAAEGTSERILTVQQEGPPRLDDETQPLGATLDALREDGAPPTFVRLPRDVDRERLWEVARDRGIAGPMAQGAQLREEGWIGARMQRLFLHEPLG
jgi:hypothetical protein